ncbi:Uncharacterised protein [uncultured archaeon]|nr:Uncharacterised protein [uncultured archaeon]
MGDAKNKLLLATLGVGLLVSTKFSSSATLEKKLLGHFSTKFRSSVLLDSVKTTKSYNDILKEIDSFWKAPKTVSLYGTDKLPDTTGISAITGPTQPEANRQVATAPKDTTGFKYDEEVILIAPDTVATSQEKPKDELVNRQNEIKLQEKKGANDKALLEKQKTDAEKKAREEQAAKQNAELEAKKKEAADKLAKEKAEADALAKKQKEEQLIRQKEAADKLAKQNAEKNDVSRLQEKLLEIDPDDVATATAEQVSKLKENIDRVEAGRLLGVKVDNGIYKLKAAVKKRDAQLKEIQQKIDAEIERQKGLETVEPIKR